MPRRAWRRRAILLAIVIVALSVGIVFANLPNARNTHPHLSIQAPITHNVKAESGSSPGAYAVTVQGLPASSTFAVKVAVTTGNATFCIIPENQYLTWAFNNRTESYPYQSCVLPTPEVTAQDTLTFSPAFTGNWNVAAINTSPVPLTVTFSPA